MGGLTWWSEVTEIAPPKHLAISLAGPAAGFLLGGVLFVAAPTLLSIVWLEHAIVSGFSDKNLLATDPDLESIRSQPGFDHILKRIS